jgi:hypothetical protein
MMLLTTEVHGGEITGTLTQPKHHTEDWRGEFTGISLPVVTEPVTGGRLRRKYLELKVGNKSELFRVPMTLPDKKHALLNIYHGQVPDWRFERATTSQQIMIATDWPEYDLDAEIVDIRQQLQAMAEEDKAAREKERIDDSEI